MFGVLSRSHRELVTGGSGDNNGKQQWDGEIE